MENFTNRKRGEVNTNKNNEAHSASSMELLVFNGDECKSSRSGDFNELKRSLNKERVNLMILNNITDVNLIEEIGSYFGIHPMILEDMQSESELPKVEESQEQLLLTLKLMELKTAVNLQQYHIGLILGSYFVLVFNQSEKNIFADIQARIENGKSKARQKKADYLFYLLIDTIIDTYYNIVDEIDNRIDKMETVLLERPDSNYIHNLYRIKQPMSDLRGILYSIREALLNIVQGDYDLIEEETLPFLHDVKDHINNLAHMFEASRDTLSDLLEINNSNINNRLNHTMKVLTIITTIFIPLTLLTGIYGMNFKHMPELEWRLGYPFALLIMVMISGIMYFIMKKNKLF